MFFFKFVVFVFLYVGTNSNAVSSTEEQNVIKGTDISGRTLLDFGRKYNKPLLSIIGSALLKLDRCTGWSNWSSCPAKVVGEFAVKTRTRKCESNKLRGESDTTTETDSSFCEGQCPSDYNITANGFCLKLYLDKKNNTDAESQCNSDKGYLINIDTKQKYTDVKTLLTGYTLNINVGGSRKDASSRWVYNYGSQMGYFEWYSGYPTNYPCLALSNPRLFYDHYCETEYAFICEIP